MVILKRDLHIASQACGSIIDYLCEAGGRSRIVGGAVRDAILGYEYSDIDIATDLLPSRVMSILSSNNIKVIPTGIKFGTVSAIIGDESFEITTLRTDITCDGRHAEVSYTDDFETDASRRDFTINALSYCTIKHEIYDYFSGIEDLQQKKLVFIGDPSERIAEDYLRILRFFRFSGRFAKTIDASGLSACIALSDKLALLSTERIKSEMDAICLQKHSYNLLLIMFDAGVLQKILPITSYNARQHSDAIAKAKSFDVSLSLETIYAILFMLNADITYKELVLLKCSKKQARDILQLLEFADELKHNAVSESAIWHALTTIWLEKKGFVQYCIFASLFIENYQLIDHIYFKLSNDTPPVFPINGNDLMKLGVMGRQIGIELDKLRDHWIKTSFCINKDELMKLVVNDEK